jgi:hypothetical protein
MQYKEVIELIEEIAGRYHANLSFDSGTLTDLNKDDSRDYPLVYLVRPITIPQVINPNNSVNQTFNLNLHFLQTGSINLTEDKYNDYFNDMLQLLNGFIAEMIKEFDEDGTDVLTIGTINQVYLQQDSVHIGWAVPLQINSVVDNDLCCSPFSQ